MAQPFLHEHSEFVALLRIVGERDSIEPILVEKDYWIMHALWGLHDLGLVFELKGGTSLSKGYKIIERFSEDIDIKILPLLAKRWPSEKTRTSQVKLKAGRCISSGSPPTSKSPVF